ncbi:hypothetical protein Pyn_26381 [Prunus yedoensis var. nudiflora]|uniref:Uncharacterized protein n=1 Tax=Prunus yedoensis var. nudiflora TaxID=2094558 RepID=A0A314YFG5_PRUYE|nr:hypothetical protein Pyn_26381 [Prunus yedoensis var. nudiflora]
MGCWEVTHGRSKFQVKAIKRPRVIGVQGKVPSSEPACIPTFLPPTDIGHEKRKKEEEKMGESRSSFLRQTLEEAWSTELIFCHHEVSQERGEERKRKA